MDVDQFLFTQYRPLTDAIQPCLLIYLAHTHRCPEMHACPNFQTRPDPRKPWSDPTSYLSGYWDPTQARPAGLSSRRFSNISEKFFSDRTAFYS